MSVDSNPEIFAAWEKVSYVWGKGTSKQLLPKARKLYEQWHQNGEWKCSAYDAHLIGSALAFRLVRLGRFEEADEVWETVSRHPLFGTDRIHTEEYLANRAFAKVLAGDVDGGLELLREGVFGMKGGEHSRCVLHALGLISGELGAGSPLDPRFRDLLKDALATDASTPKSLLKELDQCLIWRDLDNVASYAMLQRYAKMRPARPDHSSAST